MARFTRVALMAGLLAIWASGSHAQGSLPPNGSFESGKTQPDGWALEGGAGRWEDSGHSGAKCISATGKGDDSSYWRCDAASLAPNAAYRARFFVKTSAPGGCIITGASFANRDLRAGADWEEKSFIFQTPSALGNAFLRFGQWHKNGTVWFDDVEFVPVAPTHLERDGVTLGVGERIEKGRYCFSSQMSKDSSNYSRCCAGYTCGFNSNRWTLSKGTEITYRHAVAGFAQKSGKAAIGIGYYNSGECIVEARRDDGAWKEIAKLGKESPREAVLPADLLPARAVEIRLRATGSFQINDYSYEAQLDGNPPEFQGNTWFLETAKSSPQVAVEIRSLGALSPGEGNAVELAATQAGGGPCDLDIRLNMKPEAGAEIATHASVSFAGRAVVRLPYSLRSAGSYDMGITALERARGETVFDARTSFAVSPLCAADFGYALTGNEALDAWWCEPTYKVSRERPLPIETRPVIEVKASKGEYEPFQIVLRAKRDLKNVQLRIGEFRNGAGKALPPESIKADLVAYVPVKTPTDELGCVGDWPDPLPPCEKPFDVTAGKNQPIWITLHVPRDAAAGDYQGTIELAPENGPAISANVKLAVYDFEIPKETHLQVGMNAGKHPLQRYHNLETPEEIEQVFDLYNKNMSEHRIANFSIMSYYRPEVTFTGANWDGGKKVEAEKFAGKKSLWIVDDDAERCVTASSIELIPVKSGEKYEFSWAAKAEAGHPYLVTLGQHDAEKRWISGNNIDLRAEGTGAWKKETFVLDNRINPKARYVAISLRPALWSEKGEQKGTAWFDEISFRRLPDGPNMVADPGFENGVEQIEMKIDFSKFDEAGKKYLDDLGFNVFNIPLYGSGSGTFFGGQPGKILGYEQGTPEYMRFFSQYCKALTDHLVEKGWLGKSCVYWFDEPEPKDYPFVIEGMKCIKLAEPRLRRMLTEQPEPELLGHVDIWLPILDCYNREKAWARQAQGETMWWYICCGPHTPYPNNFIDHPAIEPRIWLWMTWQNKVTGCHIWTINYWNGPLVYPPPDLQNPYEDAMSYVSGYGYKVGFVGYWGNGDGRSIYPPNRDPKNDKKKYLCGPVNSIRWELLREGIEDYERFYLLNEKVSALEKRGGNAALVKEAMALLDIPADIITDTTHYTKDPRKLDAHRHKVARMIERIEREK